jgi:PAS domain S-box-containing protein
LMPQMVSIIGVFCYERFIKKKNEATALFVGTFLIIAAGICDIAFDASGRAPVIWLSPIGVVGFAMAIYIELAKHYILDTRAAERDSSRLLYAEMLMKEKERLEVTLDSISDGVICTDSRGTITMCNSAACRLTGYDRKLALSRPLTEIMKLEDQETNGAQANEIERMLESGFSCNERTPFLLTARNGTEFSVYISKAEIRGAGRSTIGFVWAFHDMTSSKNLEKIYERNQILESLGLLAGGIAHDFNAILSRIMLNINILKKSGVARNEEIESLLAETASAVARASTLTNQLLAFAKGAVPSVRRCDIRPLIMASTSYALEGRAGVRVTYGLAQDLRKAIVDAGQISQVIYNLVVNAADALEGEGDIRISGENFAARSDVQLLEQGQYVLIKISDNGIGIKKEDLGHIFEPYFTTKQSGAGFGLTNVFSVIKSHRGHIEVHSEENEGTTFSIYLRAGEEKEKDERA